MKFSMKSKEVKFTLVQIPLPPVQQIFSSMYIHVKMFDCISIYWFGIWNWFESLLVSCACERSELQTSMRFSLVYTSIWQSLIAWVFMQNPSNGNYIYRKWDSHVKTMKFHVGLKSQTILSGFSNYFGFYVNVLLE